MTKADGCRVHRVALWCRTELDQVLRVANEERVARDRCRLHRPEAENAEGTQRSISHGIASFADTRECSFFQIKQVTHRPLASVRSNRSPLMRRFSDRETGRRLAAGSVLSGCGASAAIV